MKRAGPERVILDPPKFENLQFQVENAYYDIMPGGDQFVMLLTPRFPPPTHFNVVVNWFSELQQRVPVK